MKNQRLSFRFLQFTHNYFIQRVGVCANDDKIKSNGTVVIEHFKYHFFSSPADVSLNLVIKQSY